MANVVVVGNLFNQLSAVRGGHALRLQPLVQDFLDARGNCLAGRRCIVNVHVRLAFLHVQEMHQLGFHREIGDAVPAMQAQEYVAFIIEARARVRGNLR